MTQRDNNMQTGNKGTVSRKIFLKELRHFDDLRLHVDHLLLLGHVEAPAGPLARLTLHEQLLRKLRHIAALQSIIMF